MHEAIDPSPPSPAPPPPAPSPTPLPKSFPPIRVFPQEEDTASQDSLARSITIMKKPSALAPSARAHLESLTQVSSWRSWWTPPTHAEPSLVVAFFN